MSSRLRDSALDRRQEADLAALADGRLDPAQRAETQARVDASPALRDALERQRRAVDAVRRAQVGARPRLHARVHAARREGTARRRRVRLVAGGALAAVLAAAGLVAALALPGNVPAGPTIVQAAELSLRPDTAPPPKQSSDEPQLLGQSAAGLEYPYWEDRFGWEAGGSRTDRLGDRRITTLFYQRAGQRIGYSIVDGPRLAPPAATTDKVVQGVRLRSFLADGRQVVTWVRDGRTCILSGSGVSMQMLFDLAGWRGGGEVRF